MNTQTIPAADQSILTVMQPVWPFTGRFYNLTVCHDRVEFNDGDTIHIIMKDKITDVQQLSQDFRHLRVFEFEALCKGLAHINTNVYPYWMPAMTPTPASLPGLDKVFADSIAHRDYMARATPRIARLDELAPFAAFDKMPGERTPAEQAAWDEHERILREQVEDEAEQGL